MIACLSLLLTGCVSTTKPKVITQVKTQYIFPPMADLLPCKVPFSEPPYTRNEALVRDLIWLTYFNMCARQVDRTRRWVEEKQRRK
ncbi:Rz1-like lysis system protein LysC [Vibrio sinus]|uniref:Rz1-like lysis system protein LysC n=1 Tax=Vibrio sinus TaxID=2946865 RepID=UPI003D6F3DEE